MLPFKLVYSNDYYLPIGAHVFPAEKYRLIHQQLMGLGLGEAADFVAAQPASDDDILLVHTPEYVHKLKTGTLTPQEELQMEVPYSPELVKAFWLAAGGSSLAADLAMKSGVGVNIGGGFHHAFPGHGEGFCVIHDVAVAIKKLHKDGKITRAMTVDCDVHHGNGTASSFRPRCIRDIRCPAPVPASATYMQRISRRSTLPASLRFLPSRCIRRRTILRTSRLRPLMSICRTAPPTRNIWDGWTSHSPLRSGTLSRS